MDVLGKAFYLHEMMVDSMTARRKMVVKEARNGFFC